MKPKRTQQGIDIREQINQGFVRIELGTAADNNAVRMYESADLAPALLSRHAGTALINYISAVSCLLRAIPQVVDVRSKKLLQDHVNRLLLRIHGMDALQAEADRLNDESGGLDINMHGTERINYLKPDFDPRDFRSKFDEDVQDAFDELTIDGYLTNELDSYSNLLDQSDMYPIGTVVEVLDNFGNEVWLPGIVEGHENGCYNVRFDDGTFGKSVDRSRVRLPANALSTCELEEMRLHELHMEILSEILESERQYNRSLASLREYYFDTLKKPSHWGGQKESKETFFSQCTLSDTEFKQVFSNVEEITRLHSGFLLSLEEQFMNMEVDQQLAAVFVEWAPKFQIYEVFMLNFKRSMSLIARYRVERMGFSSAEELAERYKVPPLSVLMQMPMNTFDRYIDQLKRLYERTSPRQPSRSDVSCAIEAFSTLKNHIYKQLAQEKNHEECERIGRTFFPHISLATSSRYFIFMDKTNRMEEGNLKRRWFLLFSDILICARKRKFFNAGAFCHLGTLTIRSFAKNADFGPLALVVKGVDGFVWTLICPSMKSYNEWLEKLKNCLGVIDETIPPPPPLQGR